MVLSRFFLLLLTIVLGSESYKPLKSHPNDKITVLLSDQKSFVATCRRQMAKRLPRLIIENFAQKFHSKVDYFVVNESVSFTFANQQNMKAFPNISLFRKRIHMKLYVNSLNLFLRHSRNVDILIGTIDENIHTEEYFQTSHFYYHDELTWCIQNSEPIPIWQNFFEICRDPVVWGIFAFTYFSAMSAAYILQTFEDLQPKWHFLHESISVLGHFVGFTYPYKPKRTSNRCFYIFGLFACIIFVSSFISIMTKIIHKPIFKNEVKSVQAIVSSFLSITVKIS